MSLTKTIRSIKKAEKLLVTPKIEQFLRDVPEGVIWDDEGHALFKQIIAATFGTNSDRSGRFGASSRGTCERRQIFTYLGMPETKLIDTDTLNLFSDGKWRHIRWQMMGVQSGALTHAEYPLELKKLRLTSSVDGLNVEDAFLFELKGDRNMTRLLDVPGGVVEAHNLQMHTMMLMTGWDLFSYIMEDKSTQQFREVIVHRDQKIITLVKDELERLNDFVEDRVLPDILPACAAKEGPYRGCPYSGPCLKQRHWPDGPDWGDD